MNVEYNSLINKEYDNDSSGKIWTEYYFLFIIKVKKTRQSRLKKPYLTEYDY